VGLSGLVLGGLVLWGCQSSHPPQNTLASRSSPSSSSQQASGAAPSAEASTTDSGIVQASYRSADQPLRIEAAAVKSRLAAGEPVVFLDVRKPRDASTRIAGALPLLGPDFKADPSWARDQLTVVY
jgi:hypothetical protein